MDAPNDKRQIAVYLHPVELQTVREQAAAKGLTMGGLLRELLGLPPAPPPGRRWPDELRKNRSRQAA